MVLFVTSAHFAIDFAQNNGFANSMPGKSEPTNILANGDLIILMVMNPITSNP